MLKIGSVFYYGQSPTLTSYNSNKNKYVASGLLSRSCWLLFYKNKDLKLGQVLVVVTTPICLRLFCSYNSQQPQKSSSQIPSKFCYNNIEQHNKTRKGIVVSKQQQSLTTTTTCISTEGRESIRESLRIFRCIIEVYLEQTYQERNDFLLKHDITTTTTNSNIVMDDGNDNLMLNERQLFLPLVVPRTILQQKQQDDECTFEKLVWKCLHPEENVSSNVSLFLPSNGMNYNKSNTTKKVDKENITVINRSCGLTSQCFAMLFFSKKQYDQQHHIRYTNGTNFMQLYDNWNIVLYSIQQRFFIHPNHNINHYDDKNSSYLNFWLQNHITLLYEKSCHFTNSGIGSLLRYRAGQKGDELGTLLNQHDQKEELPRVIFCNLTFVLKHSGDSTTQTTNDVDNDDVDHDNNIHKIIKDHQWIIIKNNSNSFQLVQGYIDGVDDNGSTTNQGYCLSSWQNNDSYHHDHHDSTFDTNSTSTTSRKNQKFAATSTNTMTTTNKYSSRHGFNTLELMEFIDSLKVIVSHEKEFPFNHYYDLFGMNHQKGPEQQEQEQNCGNDPMKTIQYWPSLSFRELDDNSIDGYGDRYVAHQLEKMIPTMMTRKAKIYMNE